MKKKTILMATYTLFIYSIVLMAILSSCGKGSGIGNNEEKVNEYIDVRSIYVIDIYGDTVRVTGGATCHLDKKF